MSSSRSLYRKATTQHRSQENSDLPFSKHLFSPLLLLLLLKIYISLYQVTLADLSNIGKANDGPGKQSLILLQYLGIIWSIMAKSGEKKRKNKTKKPHILQYSTNSGLQVCCKTSRLRTAWCIFLVLQLKGLSSNAHNTAFNVWHSQYTLHWKIYQHSARMTNTKHKKKNTNTYPWKNKLRIFFSLK